MLKDSILTLLTPSNSETIVISVETRVSSLLSHFFVQISISHVCKTSMRVFIHSHAEFFLVFKKLTRLVEVKLGFIKL